MQTQKLLTVIEASSILRVGRNTMYNLIRENKDFPAVRIKKQIRIPHQALLSWIDKKSIEQ